jgi:AcrR family transcriptional regulator
MATRPPEKSARMSAEERRAQLLDVTKEIAAADGFHAISIERVAREAGITRPIVYGHFEDLAGLLEALVQREHERAVNQLADVIPTELSDDPAEQLLATFHGYLEAVRAEPATWRLTLMPPEGAPKVLHESIARGRAAVVQQLALALGPASPTEEPPDPELTARMLSALADEGARLLLTEPEQFPLERILAQAKWFLGRLSPAGPHR